MSTFYELFELYVIYITIINENCEKLFNKFNAIVVINLKTGFNLKAFWYNKMCLMQHEKLFLSLKYKLIGELVAKIFN